MVPPIRRGSASVIAVALVLQLGCVEKVPRSAVPAAAGTTHRIDVGPYDVRLPSLLAVQLEQQR